MYFSDVKNKTIMDREFYKELNLDSADFRTGSINRPTFYFDGFMDDMDYIIPTRIIVPTTYYVFTAPSYTSCTINGANVTWAEGNYTPAEWITIVQPQVLGLTINYSPITNKLTFSGLEPVTISFNETQLAHTLLGMTTGNNTNDTNIYTTPNVINFSGPNYFILRSRIASVFNNSSIYFTKPLSSVSKEDHFIMIPIDVNRNSVVYYTTLANRYFEWFDSSTRNLEFYFTLGTRDEVVNFNGQSFQIKLSGYSYNAMGAARFNNNSKGIQR